MKIREIKRRRNILRARRRSITRRRKKKLLPKVGPKKTHISPLGIPLQPTRRPEPISAPKDFRLLKNTEECIDFFRKIRARKKAVVDDDNNQVVHVDLSKVEFIDFASTMMLDAVCEELAATSPMCHVVGDSPRNTQCRQYLLDSGFLNNK